MHVDWGQKTVVMVTSDDLCFLKDDSEKIKQKTLKNYSTTFYPNIGLFLDTKPTNVASYQSCILYLF